jgi:hypothetical protein
VRDRVLVNFAVLHDDEEILGGTRTLWNNTGPCEDWPNPPFGEKNVGSVSTVTMLIERYHMASSDLLGPRIDRET